MHETNEQPRKRLRMQEEKEEVDEIENEEEV